MKVILNKAKGTAEVLIYDEIGQYGLTSKEFIRQFNQIAEDIVSIRINSPGGLVFEGIAIYNYLKSSGKKIEIYIDSVAASIAGIIACAGNSIHIANSGYFMIHNPRVMAAGDAGSLRKSADKLDQIRQTMIDIYKTKSNLSQEEIEKAMNAETWYNAKQAIESGFATDTFIPDNNSDKASFDLAVVAKANGWSLPEGLINNKVEGGPSMDELLKALGCTTEAEAVTKLKGLQAENQRLATEKSGLEAKITELEKAKAEQEKVLAKATAEQAVDKEITAKKVLPAERDFAVNLYLQNKELYDSFIAGKVPHSIDNPVSVGGQGGAEEKDYNYYLGHMDEFDKLPETTQQAIYDAWDPHAKKGGK
jgi:ATP-dependent protease ClpP protease subunit